MTPNSSLLTPHLAVIGAGYWGKNLVRNGSVKGQEVDVVLEDAQGRLVGIEVKLSSSGAVKHFSGLKVLRELAGERWIAGVVLYTGEEVVPFGEKLWAAPISTLWE